MATTELCAYPAYSYTDRSTASRANDLAQRHAAPIVCCPRLTGLTFSIPVLTKELSAHKTEFNVGSIFLTYVLNVNGPLSFLLSFPAACLLLTQKMSESCTCTLIQSSPNHAKAFLESSTVDQRLSLLSPCPIVYQHIGNT